MAWTVYPARRAAAVAAVALLTLLLPLVALAPNAGAVVDPAVFRSGCGRFNSLVSEDIDGDGAHEVLFGTYEGYVVQLQYRAGDFFVEWESPQHGERCWGLVVGDVDLDGTNEIVVGDGEGDLYVYDAESHDLEWKRQGLMWRDAHGIVIADLEGDGSIEIVVGTGYKTDQEHGTIYVWAGDGSSDKPLRSYGPYDSRLRGMGVADLDGDGELELAFGSGVNLGDIEGKGYLRVLDASTGELEWQSDDLEGDVEGLAIVDTDLDERPNIVVGEGYRYREGRVHVFQFDPDSGDYNELWTSENVGPKAWGVAVGDCDADGAVEIIVGNQPGYIYIFDGTTHALEWKSELLGTDIFGMVLDDVDDDGRIEIVASQGGYQGKGDFTSGYSEPHIYVIDGASHEFEHVLGERDVMGTILVAALILLVLVALLEVGVLTKRYRRTRAPSKGAAPEAAVGGAEGAAATDRTPGESGIPGWGLDLGEDEGPDDITRPPDQEGEEGGGP